VINALTIDVEDWFHTKEFDFERSEWPAFERRIDYGMNLLLDLLDKYNAKATFFILACVAAESPNLIRRIKSKGHEIGSHGSFHELVSLQTKRGFVKDITYSKELLEDISGDKVSAFRASSWSIDKNTLWALDVLDSLGFEIDSSLQPFRTPLSGMRKSPIEPFYPIIYGDKLEMLEFPVGVLDFAGLRIPFAGGFYLRALPLSFVEFSLKKVNRKRATSIYTHPWEYDDCQPRVKVSPLKDFIHYYNIRNTHSKLESLLCKFNFAPMSQIIKNNDYKSVAL
jgi:polysaccharide deacetylase family protein (PEP-CTERM system associated)